MVERFPLEFLNPRCSFHASHSHIFILGLILAYNTMVSFNVQASTVSCNSTVVALKYHHCGIHPDGVHDLECFGKYNSYGKITCVWKPGNQTSEKTHTLIIQQNKTYCKAHINITGTSKEIRVYKRYNMTAEVYENSDSTNCTKAVFSSPKNWWRCGPPYNVSFSRHRGRLDVSMSWQQVDRSAVKYYSVRYKALGSLLWSQSAMQPQNGEKCTVENLNSSLVYAVQIRCVENIKCSQCLWSEAYTVPSELTTQPVIVSLEDPDIAERKGSRLLTLTWQFSAKEPHDGYIVTIGKASGEAPFEPINTTRPEIRLILSYSAYHLKISAVNSASTSPAASRIIPRREDEPGMGAGKLNVTVHSSKSFTLYWEDNLISKYVCYAAEWMKKGHKAAYKSFYQNKYNYRTLSPLQEPLEPYKRYTMTLHTRPNKETCNMKHINNSESTYGTTQFYFIEGSPVSAPANISYNVTLNSAVLQWLPIPEDDIRGFLLGYIIHYTEYHHRETSPERNITVDPVSNSYELGELKSGTAYEVQISGFTQAGAGVRSKASLLTTNKNQGYSNVSGIITVFAVVATVLIFGSPIIKRAKIILWPSIPNPGKSNAMQKIERSCELELLKSIKTLEVEEWDSDNLQLVEKEHVIPVSTLPSVLPFLCASDDEEDSAEMTCNCIQRDGEDAPGDTQPYIPAETFLNTQRTDRQTSPLAFSSGYTTLEMFQQVMPQGVLVSTSATQDLTVVKSGLDRLKEIEYRSDFG